jgi:dATP pyrophosphohydrolase
VKPRYDMIQCFVVRQSAGKTEFLQLLRADDDYLGNTWQIVAGLIEPGETATQAVLRELREETGLQPAELYHLDIVNTFFKADNDSVFHCPTFCAIVPANAAVLLNEEHSAFRWTPDSEIDQAVMWPGQRIALVALRSEILSDGKAKPHLRVRI